MENKHDMPQGAILKKQKYDMDLLVKLNEEYKSKPYMSAFTKYDDESQLKQALWRVKNLEKICDITNKRVLEVGCGGGYVSHCMAKYYNCQVTGIDIYESEHWDTLMVDNLEYKAVDLSTENPFEEQSFDLVISYVAWEHMRHPFKVLQECARILKTGTGYMFISANLYRSPIASHLYRHIFFPWPHLLFDDDIIIEYALSQGVEQWWIDAFYFVNKLTYSEYKEYFRILNLKIENEKILNARFDREFYERFEDKLGLYPLYDLSINFFNVLLKKEQHVKLFKRLIIDEVRVLSEKTNSDAVKSITVHCITKEKNVQYAFYLYRNKEVIGKTKYSKNNSINFEIQEQGNYAVKAFIKDEYENKISKLSDSFEFSK